jgi:hypothetical protein
MKTNDFPLEDISIGDITDDWLFKSK